MTESFLVLLAGGVMLAAFTSDPREVTVSWLRLAGIIALALTALSAFFFLRRSEPSGPGWLLYGILASSILLHLWVPKDRGRRSPAGAALVTAIFCGCILALGKPTVAGVFSSCGIAAMSGVVLMDMLLGHAYLTASKMSIRPFKDLHEFLMGITVVRAIFAVGVAMVMLLMRPIELFWDRFGLFVITRWLVGLVIPAVFIYMAYDCIKRRATQSATGILYVAGILIFIGEIMALYLLRETRLPF
jgi:hypothetical protein